MIKTIFFTGGGSGGHVMPALTLVRQIQSRGNFDIHYIGGYQSIERDLVKDYQLVYHPIHTGKLRRYLSWENAKDIFKVIAGIFESYFLLFKFNRHSTIVFSTGGFVSVPVAIAAFLQGKKVYIHEQTSRVGLANKLASYFATKVFISFEESQKYFPASKTVYAGYPMRDECYSSEIGRVVLNGIEINQISKPILFVTGGGNGSLLLNELIKNNFAELTKNFFIVHQVGKGFEVEYQKLNNDSYIAMPFIGKEMIDLFKLAKVIVSRAGAGTVCELMAMGKRSLFVPLKIAQKNEQFHNAMEANRKLESIVIEEKDLNQSSFLNAVNELAQDSQSRSSVLPNGSVKLLAEILN